MNFWLVLTANSITFGGLLFLLSAGFSLIFGLMRIPNLTHGSLFMVGAYIGVTFVLGLYGFRLNFWLAAVLATLTVAALGALAERLLLRRLPGDQLAQVLVTLGLSFMAADLCLMLWGGDPISVPTPAEPASCISVSGVSGLSPRIIVTPLWSRSAFTFARPHDSAMIRAGVDDQDMARVAGIRVSQLFTIVFALGAGLQPLPASLAAHSFGLSGLIRICCRWRWSWSFWRTGSLLSSFVGSIIVGFIYN